MKKCDCGCVLVVDVLYDMTRVRHDNDGEPAYQCAWHDSCGEPKLMQEKTQVEE